MKKILRLTLSLIMLAVCGTAFGAETTIDFTQLSITANSDGFTLSEGIFNFTATKETGSTKPTQNTKSKDIRLYAKNKLLITSSSTMTKMVFTVSKQGKKRLTDITASTGTISIDATAWTVTWEGSSKEVTLTVGDKATYGTDGSSKAGQFDVDNVIITTDDSGTPSVDVAEPTISGETPFTGSTTVTITVPDNTTVYYTTDGSTPSNSSTQYTEPFSITATTTVKAIAYDEDGNASDVVTKEFTANITGKGSESDPYTVAEVLALTTLPTDEVYIKGKVVADVVGTSYNNANYYISDDGTETNQLQVFRGKYLDGADFTPTKKLTAGDEVVVKGVLTTYNNTTEVGAGSSIITINGKKEGETVEIDPNAKGGENNPYNASEAVALSTLPVGEVYVKGIVVSDATGSDQYKNCDYYLSDDGTDTNSIEVFRGKWLNGDDFDSSHTLNAGDEVVVKGTLTTYNNKIEVAAGSSIISINGKTTGINTINNNEKKGSGIRYNLAGQRVNKDYKGLVIEDGKKYVIK